MNRRLRFAITTAISFAILAIASQPRAEERSAAPAAAVPDEALPEDSAPPDYLAADPSAPEITAATLFANERFWPYTVELTRAWKGPGMQSSAPAGTRGVLIRLDDAKRARVDFGRHGIGDVPLDATDIVARANGVRVGTEPKPLPNFVEAIGPRLVASSVEPMRPYPVAGVFGHGAFVAAFADPNAASFESLAAALAPLASRSDALVIFFPQGRPADAAVYQRLRSVGWKVPFVFQHLSEPYTASLVGPSPKLPLVTVQTADGRVLLSERFEPSRAEAIARQIADVIPATHASSSGKNP